jgi:thioredoxin 1
MSKLINGDSAVFEEMLQKGGLFLVDFWAPWCGPCKMQTPILEKIAQSNSDAAILKVNTDDNPDLAQKLNISSIPTLILFKSGKEVDRFVGLQPESVLLDKLKSHS